MKKILLTGTTGQVGRELNSVLRPLGEVISPDRNNLDLRSETAIRKFIRENKPDIIVNPAAYTSVDDAEDNPDEAFSVNHLAPKYMAQEASDLGVPVLHFSTDYVFDGKKNDPYIESDLPCPLGVYGVSKLQGEAAVSDSTEQYLILRTGWVYSRIGNNFMRKILNLMEQHREVSVVSDQYGAPTSAFYISLYVSEIVKRQLSSQPISSGIYHLTPCGNVSWYDFACEINRISLGGSASVRSIGSSEFKTKAMRPTMSRLDSGKINRVLGFNNSNWNVWVERELV